MTASVPKRHVLGVVPGWQLAGVRGGWQKVARYIKRPIGYVPRRSPISRRIGHFSHPWLRGSFGESDEDAEMMALEDTTVEELEAEFDRRQARSAPTPMIQANTLGSTLAKLLHHNFTRCTILKK